MSKPDPIDKRKADIGDKVVATVDGTVYSGVVYGVRYEDGDGDEATTWDRCNFQYIIEVGQRETGHHRQIHRQVPGEVSRFDLKKGKKVVEQGLVTEVIGTEPIMEPIHIYANDDQLKA